MATNNTRQIIEGPTTLLGEPSYRAELRTVEDDGTVHRLVGSPMLLEGAARVDLHRLIGHARDAEVVEIRERPIVAECDRCGELVQPSMSGRYISVLKLAGRRATSCPGVGRSLIDAHVVNGFAVDLDVLAALDHS